MKLRNSLPSNARKQFPPQAFEKFDVASSQQIAAWQAQITKEYELDEGEWELVDGAEAG